jgi:hypothetical protein
MEANGSCRFRLLPFTGTRSGDEVAPKAVVLSPALGTLK